MACADDDDGDSAAAPEEAETPEPDDAPRAGGVLAVGTLHNPAGFDPYVSRLVDAPTSEHLYTPLISYAGTDLTPTAAGLETWELATDGMSATLRLRAGQAFHSGAPVTADDLLVGIERAMGPDGGPQLNSATSLIASVDKVDELTVDVTFDNAMADARLTDMLVQLHLVEQDRNSSDELDNEPAGSGPFRLVDFRPGVSISLERFDDYHEPALPYLDQIDFTIFDDANTMVSALQSGEIDVAWYIPAQAAESLEAEGFQVAELEGPAVVLNVAMNPTHPPFDNRLVRQAIQRAINRQRIIDDVYFGFGQALGLPFDLVAAVYGDSPDVPETSYDLGEATRLLEEAGNPSGGVATAGASQESLLALQIIQADLREIGFDLEIDQVDQQTFTEGIQQGAHGLFLGGSGSDLRNPAFRLRVPYMRIENNVLWGDDVPAAYVAGMEAAQSASTDEELRAAADQIRQVVIEEAWNVGVVTRPDLMAAREGVHDFFRHAGSSPRPNLTVTWVDS